MLVGQHKSRMRGRGLSFEELRNYRVGDDIRTLDWKVTNRTRKPHVRVFTEERERDVLLLIDQRSHMFFGSREQMKSVTAADVAALSVWRVLSLNDRVGALVFNDQSIEKIKPQRSRKSAVQILHQVVAMNHKLSATNQRQNPNQLDQVLRQVEQLCRHDCLVLLVSDMDGLTQATIERIKRIKRHNDFMIARVFDPLERDLPQRQQLILSDGELQIQANTQSAELSEHFSKAFAADLNKLNLELGKHGIPILPIDTVTPAFKQLQQALGNSAQTGNASHLRSGD